MKKILFIILSLWYVSAFGQSKIYIRGDSVYIQGPTNGELILLNSTRSVIGGVLTNLGNGRTSFVLPTGSFNTSIGSAYKIAVNGTNNVKSIEVTNLLTGDSATAGQVGIKFGGTATASTTAALGVFPMEWTTGGAMGAVANPFKITGTPSSFNTGNYHLVNIDLSGTLVQSGKIPRGLLVSNRVSHGTATNVGIEVNTSGAPQNISFYSVNGFNQFGAGPNGSFFPSRLTVLTNGLQQTQQDTAGIILANYEPSTAAIPVQMSPAFIPYGSAWDSTAAANKFVSFWIDVLPISRQGDPQSILRFEPYLGAAEVMEAFAIKSNGALAVNDGDFGTAGQVLTSGGPNASATWAAAGGGGSGTVTSVDLAYGITGSTDPITTTGTVIADTTILVNKAGDQVIAGAKNFTATTNKFRNATFNNQHANLMTIGSVSGLEQYPGLWFGSAAPTISTYAFLGDVSGSGTLLNGQVYIGLKVNNGDIGRITSAGIRIGSGSNPTARLHIDAGTTAANTAPVKIEAGPVTTTAVAGQIERPDAFTMTKTNAVRYGVGGALKTIYTTVGNVGAGEDDLQTFSVPAGTLSQDGDYLEFTMAFSVATNSTLKVYFGAQQLFSFGALATDAVYRVTGQIIRTGAATQRATFELKGGAATSVVGYQLPTETLSGAVTLKATGEGVSNNDITQTITTVKYFPAN